MRSTFFPCAHSPATGIGLGQLRKESLHADLGRPPPPPPMLFQLVCLSISFSPNRHESLGACASQPTRRPSLGRPNDLDADQPTSPSVAVGLLSSGGDPSSTLDSSDYSVIAVSSLSMSRHLAFVFFWIPFLLLSFFCFPSVGEEWPDLPVSGSRTPTIATFANGSLIIDMGDRQLEGVSDPPSTGQATVKGLFNLFVYGTLSLAIPPPCCLCPLSHPVDRGLQATSSACYTQTYPCIGPSNPTSCRATMTSTSIPRG